MEGNLASSAKYVWKRCAPGHGRGLRLAPAYAGVRDSAYAADGLPMKIWRALLRSNGAAEPVAKHVAAAVP